MNYTPIPTIAEKLIPGKFASSNFNIFPFSEEPASRDSQDEEKCAEKVTAMDLFNFFTADIIRMDVLFIK